MALARLDSVAREMHMRVIQLHSMGENHMSGNRDYNQVYTFGRVILQIMQDGQHDRIIIDLLPTATLGVNNGRLIIGLGLRWLTGDVNFGIMTKQFCENEKKRRQRVTEDACKAGLTPLQYRRRWGW